MSGRSLSVVGRWASEDNWAQKKERYQNDLRTATREKAIEKTSDRLSDEWARVNEEHLKGTEVFRKMALQFGVALGNQFSQASPEAKAKLAASKNLSMSVKRYGSIYRDMVNLERQALGMEYMDSNKAIAKVISDGYDVIEPVDED